MMQANILHGKLACRTVIRYQLCDTRLYFNCRRPDTRPRLAPIKAAWSRGYGQTRWPGGAENEAIYVHRTALLI